MKRNKIFIIAVLLCLFFAGCERDPMITEAEQSSGTKLKGASVTYGFHVSGNRLLDANGNDFVMKGINIPYQWYVSKIKAAMPAIAATGANTVRVVIDGMTTDSKSDKTFTNILTLCQTYNLIAVLEFHPDPAKEAYKTPELQIDAALNYWRSMTNYLKGTESFVIINICNEWNEKSNTRPFRDTYVKIIRILREMGLNHTIMIDGNKLSGQGYDLILSQGRNIVEQDPIQNVMFSVHMYQIAGKDVTSIHDAIDGINTTSGLAMCVGEFGWKHNNDTPEKDDVDEDEIINYCNEKKIGWLAWSWAGNSTNVAYLDMDKSTNFDGTALTAWGTKIITALTGTPKCSIYGAYAVKAHNVQSYGPLNMDLAFAETYAAYARNTMDLGDGVKVFNRYGNAFSSVCAGPATLVAGEKGYMTLGCAAQVLDVTCAVSNKVWCRSYVHVTGNIYAPEGFEGSLEQPYTGTMLLYLSKRTTEMNAPTISTNDALFATSANDVIKNANVGNIPLTAGTYGELNVGSGNSVTFGAGTYYFKKVNIEPGVELLFPENEIVIIYIKGKLSIKSRCKMLTAYSEGVKAGANPDNILIVVGGKFSEGNDVYIAPEVNWRGTLIAPNTQLCMDSNTENMHNVVLSDVTDPLKYRTCHPKGEAYGVLWANVLAIHQRTSLYFMPFSWGKVAPF